MANVLTGVALPLARECVILVSGAAEAVQQVVSDTTIPRPHSWRYSGIRVY